MRNCLVVDDSQSIRTIACKILREMEFETEQAQDGKSALEACRTKMPDAVLVDLDLPNASCMNFLRALKRENKGKSNSPVVLFATAENDVTRIRHALSAGASEYLMKPFDRQSLADKFVQVGLA